jgi:hypothetical protein
MALSPVARCLNRQ